jgi:hypothetical protein
MLRSSVQSAKRIGEFWGYPERRAFAELLIEEDRTLRAVLVGMLREAERRESLLVEEQHPVVRQRA